MKKLSLIAIILGAAFLSCTQIEIVQSVSKQHEITFACPVTQSVTKAVDLVTEFYPITESFAVYADYHTDLYENTATNKFLPYMGNTDENRSEGVRVSPITTNNDNFNAYWSAAPAIYLWPKNGYLTFAAYAPKDVNGGDGSVFSYSITNGVKIIGYTVSSENQYDLMLSDRVTNQLQSDMEQDVENTIYDGIHIAFKHALSAIKFIVKTDIATTITLNSLKLKNVYSKGDLTQFVDKNAKAVNGDAIWSNINTESAYIVTESNAAINLSGTSFSDESNADLVLLPQSLIHSPNKVLAEITYTVGTGSPIKQDVELSTQEVGTWKAGSKYTYIITIGFDLIEVGATVEKWEEDDDINIPIS